MEVERHIGESVPIALEFSFVDLVAESLIVLVREAAVGPVEIIVFLDTDDLPVFVALRLLAVARFAIRSKTALDLQVALVLILSDVVRQAVVVVVDLDAEELVELVVRVRGDPVDVLAACEGVEEEVPLFGLLQALGVRGVLR